MRHEFRASAKGVVGGDYVFDEFEAKTMIYLIIDLTSNIILIEVIVFSLLLKKMR